MYIFLALLYVSLAAPGCSRFLTKRDSTRNSIQSIITIAKITLVHIKMFPLDPQIETSTPSIEGLTSICHDLGHLENELQNPFTDVVGQIVADVSSLEGRVRSFALTMDCPIQAQPRGETSNTNFPDSRLQLTLTKVQRYLDEFLLQEDKLKVC